VGDKSIPVKYLILGGQPRISAADLRNFERYLDTHGDTAQELYRDPDLLNDRDFVRDHSALRHWLDEHPEAAREMHANPQAVLWRERGRDADERSGASTRLSERQRQSWDTFLDEHRGIARDLARNPDLLNDARTRATTKPLMTGYGTIGTRRPSSRQIPGPTRHAPHPLQTLTPTTAHRRRASCAVSSSI
jgi:hypothetical protein